MLGHTEGTVTWATEDLLELIQAAGPALESSSAALESPAPCWRMDWRAADYGPPSSNGQGVCGAAETP